MHSLYHGELQFWGKSLVKAVRWPKDLDYYYCCYYYYYCKSRSQSQGKSSQ